MADDCIHPKAEFTQRAASEALKEARLQRKREKNREYQKAYRLINKDKIRAGSLGYAKRNRDKINARVRADYAHNPDKYRERTRVKYLANPNSVKDRARAYRAANIEKSREYSRRARLKRRYGLTHHEYNEMLKAQGGACAICRHPFAEGRNPPVDHCHRSGRVRAVLCITCNAGLALFKDDPGLMAAAIDYVQHHRLAECGSGCLEAASTGLT